MTDYQPPGNNERSTVYNLIQNLVTVRTARGTIEGFRTHIKVRPMRGEEGTYWNLHVQVTGDRGVSESWNRNYATRVDAYQLFEWYLRQHDELEEVDVVPEGASDAVANARVGVLSGDV